MYDLAVIGLGPAGLEAVDIAIKNNLNVIAFEKNMTGGICLNIGCIPTKAILHCSQFYKDIKKCSNIGINLDGKIDFDWAKISERKDNIVQKFTKSIDMALSKKIKIVRECAFVDVADNKITINNDYHAKKLIIATGSIPYELKELKFDHKFILNSDDMFNLQKLPESIAIVGSGAIGLEWAKILSDFGSSVKIIEKAPSLAPLLDIDLQKRVERILKQNNIQYYKNDYVKNVENHKIILNSGVEFDVDIVLSAAGRVPVLPQIKLDGKVCELKISDNFKTNIDNIFVAGDANKDSMLAHSASYQARAIMNNILFNDEIIKKPSPSVIYITPEIASIGIREQDIENCDDYKILKFSIPALAKSWCDEANDGVVKVIVKDNLIYGAHIVSKEASSLVSMFNIFIDEKIKISDISNMIFPHPSYAEAVLEVLKNA